LEVDAIAAPGVYRVDDNLYLQIKGGRSWLHRYMFKGRPRDSGLGSADTMTLAQARAARDEERLLIRKEIDPVAKRRDERQQSRVDSVKAITFKECADAYIKAHEATWRNAIHRQQWRNTLDTYVHPIIGALPVHTVDTALAMRVLEPIWQRVPESASRIRGRCECIIDWAKARGYRDGENPFRWRGHLNKLFPSKAKIRKVQHHAALPYGDLPAFMVALRERNAVAARALEFLILVAGRTGEVLGAKWTEIDIKAKLWTIPAERMKGGIQHRVPLAPAALAVIDQMRQIQHNDFIFPGMRGPLSNMALLTLLGRMNHDDLTAHGFRSTFKDWATEQTGFPSEAVEMALAHVIEDKVEAAYRRGDLLEKRRKLADAWAGYCAGPAGAKVLPLNRRQAI
jgi:integrase